MQCQSVNSCCGINGCTSVSVERIGECFAYAENLSYSDASFERVGYADADAERVGDADASATELSNRLNLTTALICKTAQGEWEFLAVEEGQVIDINGEKIMVRRY